MSGFSFSDMEVNHRELKLILLFRSFFAVVLSFSTFVFCMGKSLDNFSQPYISLHGLSFLILFSSLLYFAVMEKSRRLFIVVWCWAVLETVFVTAIVFITGSFESIFTFLYLVVIICSSLFLLYRGTLLIAAVASLQYCLLVCIDYFTVFNSLMEQANISSAYDLQYIVFKVVMVVSACFIVAVLSGLLALRAKSARYDLKITKGHLRRVERMTAMSEMLAGITHEVKNPLASLSGAIQLLKENTEPGEPDYRLIKIVLRETEKLESLINDFHMFAKPKTTNAVDLQVDTTIPEIVELFSKDPDYHTRIRFSTDLETRVIVHIDPVHFNQIIWNLLKNAAQSIKAKGDILIRLKYDKRNRVYITIEDNGCGIDRENIQTVFDPFYTTRPEGTGLGLAIVHRLVDKYQGMIDVESTPGRGSVFTIIFEGYRISDKA